MRQLLRKAGFIPASRRKDVWRLLILGRVDARAHGSGEDILALDAAILSTELDLDNQRVVRVDVDRTRPALEQFKRPRVKNMLARVLTHHCKTNGLGYKQVRPHVKISKCVSFGVEASSILTSIDCLRTLVDPPPIYAYVRTYQVVYSSMRRVYECSVFHPSALSNPNTCRSFRTAVAVDFNAGRCIRVYRSANCSSPVGREAFCRRLRELTSLAKVCARFNLARCGVLQ